MTVKEKWISMKEKAKHKACEVADSICDLVKNHKLVTKLLVFESITIGVLWRTLHEGYVHSCETAKKYRLEHEEDEDAYDEVYEEGDYYQKWEEEYKDNDEKSREFAKTLDMKEHESIIIRKDGVVHKYKGCELQDPSDW